MLESVQQSNDVEYSSIYLNISNIIEQNLKESFYNIIFVNQSMYISLSIIDCKFSKNYSYRLIGS